MFTKLANAKNCKCNRGTGKFAYGAGFDPMPAALNISHPVTILTSANVLFQTKLPPNGLPVKHKLK